MRVPRLRGELSLVHQGLEVAVGFGVRSLEGLVSVAELVESSVYERGSLHRTRDGIEFTLRNPPLRMGAFRAVRMRWNGREVPPADARAVAGVPPRTVRFDEVDRGHPLVLPVGQRTRIGASIGLLGEGRPRIRLELESQAIPPRVWFEFSDVLAEEPSPP